VIQANRSGFHSGMARIIKASNIGTVKAVCPWMPPAL
jgi:hypothetical protein